MVISSGLSSVYDGVTFSEQHKLTLKSFEIDFLPIAAAQRSYRFFFL